ncbi:hypothetical protein [Fructilactobacillus frigidiflavus]|uniref:hypothetical protein n=1 Tax=Fructilactobacillus frigidiflavus TaxID=3242688 RepID=UPI0037564EC8
MKLTEIKEVKKMFRRAMCDQGLTIDDISAITGVSTNNIKGIIRGDCELIRTDDYVKVVFLLFKSYQMREMAQIYNQYADYVEKWESERYGN